MAYNSSTQIITAPVAISDVQRCLGVSANDVRRLCESTAVKKWAKYKPLNIDQTHQLTASQRAAINYGIKDIPVWSRLTYMNTFLFDASRGSLSQIYWPTCDREKGSISLEYWTYDKPSGGGTVPDSRLSDFADYYHGAQAPMTAMNPTTIHIDPTALLTIQFPIAATHAKALNFSDFILFDGGNEAVSGMYFGVIMKQVSGSLSGSYAITQSTTVASLGTNGAVVQIQLSASDTAWAGTWNIYPIISEVAIPSLLASGSFATIDGNYLTCPLPYHNQNIIISIKKAKFTINISSAYRNSDGQHVTVEVSLTNTDSEPRNYRVQFTVYDSSDNVLATQDIISANSVSGGATVNREVNITVPNGNLPNAYRLYALSTVTDSNVVFKESSDAYSQIGDEPPTPPIP